MRRARRILAIITLSIGAFFTCTASVALDNHEYLAYSTVNTVQTQSVIPVPDEPIPETEKKDESLDEEASLNVLLGTISASIIGIITATGATIRALRKYKETQIADYEQAAKDADAKRMAAVDRQHEAEAERDKLSRDFEEARSEFLAVKDRNFEKNRKEIREYGEKLEKLHIEYNQRLDEAWNKLLITLAKLRDYEYKLMELGVKVDPTPPPFTPQMLDDVTVGDRQAAAQPLTGEITEVKVENDTDDE